jgi:stage II sporulation protein AA (anti-sigma F factor antagonist)
MSEQKPRRVISPVVVLRIEAPQFTGDTLAEELRDEFLGICSRAAAQNVVLDFRSVVYISSAGFRPLLSLLREIRGRGGRLILCGLNPDVHETFTVTRLISTSGAAPAAFEVQPDIRSAVAALDLSVPPKLPPQ